METQPPPAKVPKLSGEEEEEQEKVIRLLEKRLEKHDENRKVTQDKLQEVRNKLAGQIDELEERITEELCEKFTSEEGRLQSTLSVLCENWTTSALQNARAELSVIQSYEIIENKEPSNDLTSFYELKAERRFVPDVGSVGLAIPGVSSFIPVLLNAIEKCEVPCGSDKFSEERERLVGLLEERLEMYDNNRKAVQDKLHEICEGLRTQIDKLEKRITKELEDKFIFEDNRLQSALNELRGSSTASALQKAKAELLVEQSYEIIESKNDEEGSDGYEEEEYDDDDDDEDEEEEEEEGDLNNGNENDDGPHENDTVNPNPDLTSLYELKTERRIVPELMEVRKPTNVRVAGVNRGRVPVEFTCLNPGEERVLSDRTIVNPVKYSCLLFKKGNEQESKKEYSLDKNEGNDSSFSFAPDILETETTYGIRVKIVVGTRVSEWSDEIAEFTPEFKECCVWKKCPDYVDDYMKYGVYKKNPRVATSHCNSNDRYECTIIGNACIPPNTVASWNIKILKSEENGYGIFIGVAQNDIGQNGVENYYNCGWYFNCYRSTLSSGPPHNYVDKDYGPRKEEGEYVHAGDSVGVVMDTTNGELSFVLNGVNYGVAYEGIPLDKPLVPCVLLWYQGDSVELDTSEVKENNVDSSVSIPSNIAAKNGSTWDSITLTWDEVGNASFYQIEVDGSKCWDVSTTNGITKMGLLLETEHSFRVRAVRGSSVSGWSDVVKGKTLKESFKTSGWKECPGYVCKDMKYNVNEKNPRVATSLSNDYRELFCVTLGNTHIPFNTVTSWNVKMLKSKKNDGEGIFIGIAPFDIDQNGYYYYDKCGWYFYCYYSSLYSGPPHSYRGKDYGPRKEGGEYVHTGDSVGVVMDTTNGDLSFVLNGTNHGVAYEGIPLDKPLVPCVLLWYQGDSVELII